MDTLGIPERSFYRYLSQAYEHDRQLLQEQDKNNLALELWILHERLTNAYRRLVLIASNEEEEEDISAKDRINAETAAACEVALAITKLAFEGPIILKGFRSLSLCKDVPRFTEILKAQDAHEPINMTRSNPTELKKIHVF
jgi:hypothetical protein